MPSIHNMIHYLAKTITHRSHSLQSRFIFCPSPLLNLQVIPHLSCISTHQSNQPMKDLSFFLFKNSLGARMKKGFRNSCNGDGSTSTLNQHLPDSSCMPTPSPDRLDANSPHSPQRSPTLEEMILQLELEEEIARKSKLNKYSVRGRMSCVNNSDILRSARKALNQYPRFSLDGKDAMYRSSFRNFNNSVEKGGRKSVCCDHGVIRERFLGPNSDYWLLPPTVAGESVVWCKPSVVAKLMGLEAMPVPISRKESSKEVRCIIKRQNLRRRAERHEMERRLAMNMKSCNTNDYHGSMRGRMASCSKAAAGTYKSVVNPENNIGGVGGRPTGRFL